MDFNLGDLKEYIGSLKRVDNFTNFFRKYEFIEHEGKEYLAGKEHIQKEATTQYNTPALLFALVRLLKPPHPPQHFDRGSLKKIIPNKNILRFCKKFGLPYIEKVNELDPGFELDHFRYRVAWLYTRFSVWYALTFQDERQPIIKEYATRWHLDEGSTLEAAKKLLAAEVSMGMMNVRLTSEYKNGKFFISLYSTSLIDVAYFQLAGLLTMKEPEVRSHLKTCNNPECKRFFWSLHGHQKYCEFCDRRTVHARMKKMGGDNNDG